MRALIQRVTQACVTNEDDSSAQPASIEKGYVILLGVGRDDSEAEVKKLWSKIAKLRIFEDDQGKTNLSLKEVEGQCWLFRSSPFMRPVRREIVLHLPMREILNVLKHSIAYSSNVHEKRVCMFSRAGLVLTCRSVW